VGHAGRELPDGVGVVEREPQPADDIDWIERGGEDLDQQRVTADEDRQRRDGPDHARPAPRHQACERDRAPEGGHVGDRPVGFTHESAGWTDQPIDAALSGATVAQQRIFDSDDLARGDAVQDRLQLLGCCILAEIAEVSRAVTDSLATVRFNPEQAGLYNLLTMIESLSGRSRDDIEAQFAGSGYKPVKDALAEAVIATLAPLQERYREFESDPEVVDRVLAHGAEKARGMAHEVVDEVERRIGLRRLNIPSRVPAQPI